MTALAAGTVFEKYHGSEWASDHFYTSWWFVALLALVACGAIVSIVQGRMWKRPATLLIHLSVPVILLGGALTTWVGEHGTMTLHPGEPATQFECKDKTVRQLPFAVTLQQFEVVPYAGTHTPMDFVSHITADGEAFDISMNHIYRRDSYRFYQQDYDEAGNSVLAVAHDPWGIAVTYCGYALLLIGLLWMMLSPRERFRKLMKGSAATAVLLLLLAAPARAMATPRTLPAASAREMGEMYVLYKGRVCPVQTFAKDFTTKLTGKASWRGYSSEQVLAGFIFYPSDWCSEPLIKVKGDAWKADYGIDGRRASYMQLLRLEGENFTPATEKSLREASEKYNLVKALVAGKSLKLFPVADSTGHIGWYGQNDELPLTVSDDEYLFIRKQLSYCQELVVKGDYQTLGLVFAKTRAYQERQAAGALPPAGRISAERLYNNLTTGRWVAMLSITLGLLYFAYNLVLTGRRRPMPKALRRVGILWVTALSLFLTLIFVLRWVAGGHVPMAGGFDSMNLMAIAIGVVALCMNRRYSIAIPAGMLTMGFCLLVAMMSGSNPPVTNLMPVLNSPLLTLHVTVIMFSYALFFFIMTGGIAGLIMNRRTDIADGFRRVNLMLLYPAVFLLALGIVIGAVWANISWGSYWSWDPKEVWALITLIIYAIPMHASLHVNQSPRRFHLYCTLAFLSVVITYFGVNLILGGIHAYN
ncbi:MAG: cytochrome c assembly protein [bacterium P3]|nr:MAG: cytochrome c assembly protein [bacterium P3]KWW40066.1 MAG: cytochrome c assembly protein [bacterium F083]